MQAVALNWHVYLLTRSPLALGMVGLPRVLCRMTSVNMIFVMGGPQPGEVEAGLVASRFPSAGLGARVAVVTGGSPRWWSPGGAAWCETTSRRTPRHLPNRMTAEEGS